MTERLRSLVAPDSAGGQFGWPAMLAILLTPCVANASREWNNPDRDLTGFGRSPPLLATDLVSLRKLAIRRTDLSAKMSADDATRLIVDGARHCHSGSEARLTTTGYLQSTSYVPRIVEIQRWSELNATAIGFGFDEPRGKAYFVVIAVVDAAQGSSSVYAYNRLDDDKRQSTLVSSIPAWLAGRTSECTR